MIYIGIDPGSTGGISFIGEDIVKSYELQFKDSGDLDLQYLINLFKGVLLIEALKVKAESNYVKLCLIERPIAMPSQNIKGTATSFINYGKLLAFLILYNIPFQEIKAVDWKKEFNLITKKKKGEKIDKKTLKLKSVNVASHLFPSINFYTERGRMLDGMAESLLICEYGKRKR